MTKPALQNTAMDQEEVVKYQTKHRFQMIFIFAIVLMFESLSAVVLLLLLTNIFGELILVIDLPSIVLLIIGAITITYYYITRYVKRVLILEPKGFCLKVGKRSFEYLWSDFSLVALSVAYSYYGAKGFVIKLYHDDLEGDYVDLPIYRFPKTINVFDLRNQIEEKIRFKNAQIVETGS